MIPAVDFFPYDSENFPRIRSGHNGTGFERPERIAPGVSSRESRNAQNLETLSNTDAPFFRLSVRVNSGRRGIRIDFRNVVRVRHKRARGRRAQFRARWRTSLRVGR